MRGLVLVEFDPSRVDALRRGVERGVALAEAANFARDLSNEPGNHLTPTDLAERARALAEETGLECTVYDQPWMEEQGMGALLGVAKGSHQPPKFIVLRYRGRQSLAIRKLLRELKQARAEDKQAEAKKIRDELRKEHGYYISRQPEKPTHLVLVGKGVTFDTGGISIKPAAGMEEMKGDMSGGAAVIAAMGAIARLKPAINVTAIVPATENMPGGSATKPGDVLRTMSGKTIEVINTDAEGRLILADGLAYARKLRPTFIADVATLTAALPIALGNVAQGPVTTHAPLSARTHHPARVPGELGATGWVKPEYERRLCGARMAAGAGFGLTLFGLRALNAMRLEKNFGGWAREYRPLYGPLEAGLERFIAYSKPAGFIGKEAALAERESGGTLRLKMFVLEAKDADVIGDEPVWLNGEVVGWVTSGGYAHNSGVSMAMGYVAAEHANAEGPWQIELLGERLPARVQHAPIWDANAERMRG